MNRNLSGELLSIEELQTIATSAGIEVNVIGIHDPSSVRSELAWATREVRLAMMWRGELLLDTRLENDQ